MQAGKLNVFRILQIRKQYSGERHILMQKDRLDKTKLLFGIAIDRRTLCSAFANRSYWFLKHAIL